MPDAFDPYREALVMEEVTVWPEEFDDVDADERSQLERKLHDAAEQAGHLEYIRGHTGFCRSITVTAEDLARVR